MSGDLPSRVVQMPGGSLAVDKTVDLMARAAMGEYGAHSSRIRRLALDIITRAGVPEKDKRGEAVALRNWVMQHLRYVNDPAWMEFVTQPETLAFEVQHGDCDDHSVLLAALLGAIGIRTRFVTVAAVPGPMSHVYLQADVGKLDGTGQRTATWLDLDPIVKNRPAGWSVPNPYRVRIFPVNTPAGIGGASPVSLLSTLAGLAGLLLRLR